MANNPLYPGYSPKKEGENQINPLYPGYYAGQPLPRRPFSKNFVRPIEYNADVLMDSISETADRIGETMMLGAPKWIVDRVVSDFKNSWKVAIKPSGMDITELDDYELQDFPGAQGISMSLNPLDYIKDPKTHRANASVTGTLKDWVKKSTGFDMNNILNSDFGDIENKTRQRTWRLALGYGHEEMPADIAAAESVAERLSSFGFKTTGKPENPLNLSGVNIDSYTIKEDGKTVQHSAYNDLYKKTVDKIGEFEQYRGAKLAPAKHEDFIREAINAANIEIAAKYNSGVTEENAAIKKQFEQHSGAFEFFSAKSNVLKDVHGIQDSANKFSGSLKGLALSGGVNSKLVDQLKSVREAKSPDGKELGFNKKLELVSSLLDKKEVSKTHSDYLTAFLYMENRIKKSEEHIATVEKLRNEGKISEYGYNNFRKIANDYESYLKNLNEAVSKIGPGELSGKAAVKAVDAVTKGKIKLNTVDILQEGLEQKLSRNLEFDMLGSKERKNLNGELVSDQIGSLLQDETLQGLGVKIEASKLAPIAYRLRREKILYTTEEFLESWDKGKLLEDYLWNNRIKPRIKTLLPSTYVEKFLKSRNYFGLQLTDEGMDRLRKLDSKDNGKRVDRTAAKYAFSVKVGLEDEFIQLWGLKKLNVKGGKHFDFLNNGKLRSFDLNNSSDRRLLKDVLTGSINENELSKKLFGGLSLTDAMGNEEYKKQYKKFIDEADAFQEWIQQNRGVLGKNVDDPNFQYALFEQFYKQNKKLPPGYKLNRRLAGGFDKVYMKLEQVRMWFMSTKLGKAIAMTQNWKSIVANKISSLVSKLLSELIAGAAATTGFLAVVMPVIQKVVEYAIQKILKYGEAAIKGVLKGDFKELAIMIEKDIKRMISCGTAGCLILSLPFLVAVGLFVGLFGISISPIDRTISGEIVRCYRTSSPYFSVSKVIVSQTATKVTYRATVTPGARAGEIPADTEVTYKDTVVATKTQVNPQTGQPEDVSVPIGGFGPYPLINTTSGTSVTYDINIDSTLTQNSRIQNFFSVSIPKLSDKDQDSCHEQIIVTTNSFVVGAGVPSEMDACAGYETSNLQCEEN